MEYNYLPENAFDFSCTRLPNVAFYAQDISLPSVQVPSVSVNVPTTQMMLSGDQILISDFEVTFLVDRDMKTYREMLTWLKETLPSKDRPIGIAYPVDAEVSIMSHAFNKKMSYVLEGIVPVSLGSLTFRTTDNATTYLTCSVSFSVNNFDVRVSDV